MLVVMKRAMIKSCSGSNHQADPRYSKESDAVITNEQLAFIASILYVTGSIIGFTIAYRNLRSKNNLVVEEIL